MINSAGLLPKDQSFCLCPPEELEVISKAFGFPLNNRKGSLTLSTVSISHEYWFGEGYFVAATCDHIVPDSVGILLADPQAGRSNHKRIIPTLVFHRGEGAVTRCDHGAFREESKETF